MSPLTISQEKLLITGVNGYIGFKTLLIALERGYNVRALVRKESHVTDLQARNVAIAESSKPENGQLEFGVVPDFLQPDAVFNVLHGVTVIIHLASPLAVQTENYDADIIQPAISMVTTFLEAATRVPTVRRVVITSSCVTLIPFEWNMNPDSERIYTPTDLNTNLHTPPTSPMEAYWISKGLARLATKNFIKYHAPSFDFINLLAGVVIGPDERLISSKSPLLSTSTTTPVKKNTPAGILTGTRASVLAPILTADLSSPFPYVGVPVHVADVARAHVDAVDGDVVPGNSEYILASDAPQGVNWNEDGRGIVRKWFPEEVARGVFPFEGGLETVRWRLDASETERVFGWAFTGFEETMRGLAGQYLELRG
ncbi:NAD(P)-binding protein [Aspergillus californicus]